MEVVVHATHSTALAVIAHRAFKVCFSVAEIKADELSAALKKCTALHGLHMLGFEDRDEDIHIRVFDDPGLRLPHLCILNII